MDSRELASHINYLGMERCARKIILKDNLAKAEDIAIMTDFFKKEKMEEFNGA